MDNFVNKSVYNWIRYNLPGLILALGGLIFDSELVFKNLYYKNLTRARGTPAKWCEKLLKKANFNTAKFCLCQFSSQPAIIRAEIYHTNDKQSRNLTRLDFIPDMSHAVLHGDAKGFFKHSLLFEFFFFFCDVEWIECVIGADAFFFTARDIAVFDESVY